MSSASDIHSILYKGEDPLKKKFTPQCETRQKVKRLFPGRAPHYAAGDVERANDQYDSEEDYDHTGLAVTASISDKRNHDAQRRRLDRLERLQKGASDDSESSTDDEASSNAKDAIRGTPPTFAKSGKKNDLLCKTTTRVARVLVKRRSRSVRAVPATAASQGPGHGSDSMEAGSSDEAMSEDEDEGNSRHRISRGSEPLSVGKHELSSAGASESSAPLTDDEIAARRQRLKERILEEQKKLEIALVNESRKPGGAARLKSQDLGSAKGNVRSRRSRRGDDASEGSMESGSSSESEDVSVGGEASDDDDDDREGESDSEGDDDSDYDDDVESDAVEFNRMRPVFLSTKERELLRQQRGLRDEMEDSTYSEEARQALAEQRRKEAKRLLVETIKEEETEKRQQAANRNNLFNDNGDLIDDTDGVDPEAEHRAWREREIARNKRDNVERVERQRFLLEIERRRTMTDAERLDDDRRLDAVYGKTHLKKGGKYLFLQKYYHKGAFFQDKAVSGEEPLYQRNFNEPVGEDKLDKKLLPAPMRLRRGQFGKAGQVKHTHLADIDTTDLTAPVRIKYTPLRSGAKVRKADH